MLLYLARATQVMDLEIQYPHAYLDNVGTLHSSLDEAQRALGIALINQARTNNDGFIELNIIWDEPTKARCVVRSFVGNGNEALWMEAAIGQINKMKVSAHQPLSSAP